MKTKQHLELLGMRVEDRVTGLKGIVASISFDLYGCVQAIVNPGLGKDGKLADSVWFDVARLRVISKAPVMERPDFENGKQADGKQGASEKPMAFKP